MLKNQSETYCILNKGGYLIFYFSTGETAKEIIEKIEDRKGKRRQNYTYAESPCSFSRISLR